MASTSLSLGPHWEHFIKEEVASGRYGSATEVVRDALRQLEERHQQLQHLRNHLAVGAAQAQQGNFVEQAALQDLLGDFKGRPRD